MLNTILLQGRLTETPELKTTPSGKYVTSFSLAVERDFSTGDDKETDFIPIVVWGNTAEFVGKYFTKGKQMLVKGSLQVRKFQTKNGENRYATEVIADKVYFAGDKAKTSQDESYGTPEFVEIESVSDDDLPF